jgi:hypothetical protein
MSARLSVRSSALTTRIPWTGFHEFWYLSIFRKSVEKIQVSLKSGKNNEYVTLKPINNFDHSGYRVNPGGKAAGAWRLPLTPSSAKVKEKIQL